MVPGNLLGDETSPYLLQHRDNPVHWRPWGDAAFAEARGRDAPVMLSIGYSSCHWCHVMAHESFASDAVAAILNERFVSVKVDREERPDVDEIYMGFVQATTGSGGWPLTAFLAPDRTPFFGGTYFPPDDQWGRPGFRRVLLAVSATWRDPARRAALLRKGEGLLERQRQMAAVPGSPEAIVTSEPVERGVRQLLGNHDARHGGFGPAPKFPPSRQITLLLRSGNPDALEPALGTLRAMANGGLRDQIGGGFHRYSTDAEWLVPHFEKMLYDNALLVPVYAAAHRIRPEPLFEEVIRSTIGWAEREMRAPEGGWRSALDADSEGEEGRFYVWRRAEIDALLGEDAELAAAAWDVRPEGNWEGRTVLRRVRSDMDASRLERARAILLAAREERERPGLDGKVLLGWNALWISALARAHRALGETAWMRLAQETGRFALDRMRSGGRYLAVWDGVRARIPAMLGDHAFLLRALIDLYRSDFDETWLAAADEVADLLAERFRSAAGGFHTVADDHEPLPVRTRNGFDGALPSGNAVAAESLLRLSELTGAPERRRLAREVITAFLPQLAEAPAGFPTMLTAILGYLREPEQLVVVGEPGDALRALWREADGLVLLAGPDAASSALPALRAAAQAAGDGPAFLPCRGGVCSLPLRSLDDARRWLRESSGSPASACGR